MVSVDNYFDQAGSDGNNEFNIYGDVDANGTVFTAEQVKQAFLSRFDSIVVVHSADDLAGELDSMKLYWIDGRIDMGSTQIQVPDSGIAIYSPNPSISWLTSSEDDYTMFVNADDDLGSGGINIEGIRFTVGGSNSQVFNIDNTNDGGGEEFSVIGCNFIGCTSIGYVAGYRQGFINNFFALNCDDGLTIDKTWTGFRATTGSVINTPSTFVMFKAGDSLSIGNFLSDFNFLSVDSDAVFSDISASNIVDDGGFSLDNFRTTASDAMPNLAASEVKARFKNCTGISNTYVGGRWQCTTQATTTISSVGVAVKLAGTTTYSDMVHFSQTTNNAFVNANSNFGSVRFSGNIVLSGDANDSISLIIRKWDASASAYVDTDPVFTRTVENNAGGLDVALIPFETYVSNVDGDDRLEVWVRNNTDTSNVVMRAGSYVNISERV